MLSVPRHALSASTFLPRLPSARLCSPRLSRLAPLRYYAGSDSCRASPARQVSLLPPLCLQGIPPPTTWCARMPLCQSPQRIRSVPHGNPGFALHEQARRNTPPNRVRHPAGCLFASGCSPPRLAATQLPSATWVVTSHGVDSHHADRTASQTHSCPALCRASTSWTFVRANDGDGRDKPGHDDVGWRP